MCKSSHILNKIFFFNGVFESLCFFSFRKLRDSCSSKESKHFVHRWEKWKIENEVVLLSS